MNTLINLPGVAEGRIDKAPFFHSVSRAIVLLRKHRACVGVGTYGAVVVYQDDEGKFHCSFQRNRTELDLTIVSTKKGVRRWLIEWYPHTLEGTRR